MLGLYGRLSENYPKILELKFVNLNFNQSVDVKSVKLKQPKVLFEEFYFSVVGRTMNAIEKEIFTEVVKQTENEVIET